MSLPFMITGNLGHHFERGKQGIPLVEDLRKMGSNPTAHLAAGVTYQFKEENISLDFKYEHVSHYLDGAPFNNNKEWHLGQFKFVVRKYLNN